MWWLKKEELEMGMKLMQMFNLRMMGLVDRLNEYVVEFVEVGHIPLIPIPLYCIPILHLGRQILLLVGTAGCDWLKKSRNFHHEKNRHHLFAAIDTICSRIT
jgi:hypothetical protein